MIDTAAGPAASRSLAAHFIGCCRTAFYCGEIVHKKNAYPGLHKAIIEEALWNEVQATLAKNRVERVTRSKAAGPSLLAGLVYDESGARMSPTHANKIRRGVGGAAASRKSVTRYRYYVSQSLIKHGRLNADIRSCRVPAADLETIVENKIRTMLRDEAAVFDAAGAVSVSEHSSLIERAKNLSKRWSKLQTSERRALLRTLVERIDVRPQAVDIKVRLAAITVVTAPKPDVRTLRFDPDGPTRICSVPTCLRRTGMENKLLVEGNREAADPQTDRSLIRLIGQAHRFRNMLMKNSGGSMRTIAAGAGVSPSYFTRVLRLSFLAPKTTSMILQGRQPVGLTANRIMHTGQLALSWSGQKDQLGFD